MSEVQLQNKDTSKEMKLEDNTAQHLRASTSSSLSSEPSTIFSNQMMASIPTTKQSPLDATSLPLDHPVYMLEESRMVYESCRPPFVQDKYKCPVGSRKPVILATRNGHFPEAEPTTAEFVAREWSKTDVFWTLDLDGYRWIVKAFGSGSQGATYRKWLGHRNRFSETTVAFFQRRARTATESKSSSSEDDHVASSNLGSLTSEDEDEDGNGIVERLKKRRAHKPRIDFSNMYDTSLPNNVVDEKETISEIEQQVLGIPRRSRTKPQNRKREYRYAPNGMLSPRRVIKRKIELDSEGEVGDIYGATPPSAQRIPGHGSATGYRHSESSGTSLISNGESIENPTWSNVYSPRVPLLTIITHSLTPPVLPLRKNLARLIEAQQFQAQPLVLSTSPFQRPLRLLLLIPLGVVISTNSR